MSNLFEFIRAGGVIMIPLLLLSLGAIAVIIERFLAFKTWGESAPDLLPRILEMARESRFEEAIELCEKSSGPIAACLAAILRHRDRPVQVAERHVEEIGQEYFARLERLLPFLDTATTISPLLGLLGTIVGMIGTFNAIGAQTRNGGNSDAVLAGVGEALYATATGITIAVVCFVAYNYFASRLRTITSECESASTKLINALIDERAGYFSTQEIERELENAVQKTA
ncbi:biopolymer transport protein ExbB [Abditibacterium utsteinense]|uniref:Biopolymer transport protein ExbB n=1 Tax=Abditibacterium utsteinense TaxID=1960156 RepID=A0A2S8SV58_9BACT|nr:MotA/TolQ/ExbB proton channel family protein [Abditibacterium utsteinense]PQV64672.1 biopolymer transport protein ExbB [Abditibacterium utsteinense]